MPPGGGSNDDGDDEDPSSSSPSNAEEDTMEQPSPDVADHPAYARFRIPSSDFMAWWKHLQAAGWTYRATKGEYRAPDGRVWPSAKAVTDYLNAHALPLVYTNLRWATSSDDDDTGGDGTTTPRAVGRAQRRAVLQKCYDQMGDDMFRSAPQDDDAAVAPTAPAVVPEGRQRRASRPVTAAPVRTTVTAVEKGADLYLRKPRGRATTSSSSSHPQRSQGSLLRGGPAAARRWSVAECQQFLQSHPMEAVAQIEAKYRREFPRWRFLLSTNHSLLFYGAGSKRELLHSFVREELYKEGESIVVDGVDKDVTLQGILDVLVQVCLGGEEPAELSAVPCPPENVPVIGKHCPLTADPAVERAIRIGRGVAHMVEDSAEPIPPTFLVIHSLDATLGTPLVQEALSMLVTNSTVANGVAALRLVASVNHVDAPTFLWKPVTEANLAWFPCCVHTHRPFLHELSLLADQDTAQRKKTERASRTHAQAQRVLEVLKHLAPRHTEVVQLLARLQVSGNEWVDYLHYRDRCKSGCAITKDSQLRSLLTELQDHGLVVSKTEGSREYVQIPFTAAKLREIIDFQREA